MTWAFWFPSARQPFQTSHVFADYLTQSTHVKLRLHGQFPCWGHHRCNIHVKDVPFQGVPWCSSSTQLQHGHRDATGSLCRTKLSRYNHNLRLSRWYILWEFIMIHRLIEEAWQSIITTMEAAKFGYFQGWYIYSMYFRMSSSCWATCSGNICKMSRKDFHD